MASELVVVMCAGSAGPSDEVPTLIAALALAVLRTALQRWASEVPKDDDDTPLPNVQRAAALVHTLFADAGE
jgi:hypothetical protein